MSKRRSNQVSVVGSGQMKRGSALLWSVVGLALAASIAPLYVSLCRSLSLLAGRGAHRLVATQAGARELERLHGSAPARNREFLIPELPGGRGAVTVTTTASPQLREVHVEVAWLEAGRPARSAWTTLVTAK